MHNIIIESLEYNGNNYFYKNDKFKKGVNIILGENQHGKTTFTYLILYALGFDVEAFNKKEGKSIDEICDDSNNYILLGLFINGISYAIKRKVGENIISVITPTDTCVFPINRNNSLFIKDNKTFSDWLLETLGIDSIKVENIFSAEHYLNFDDLFRYSYYDQQTPKTQMISDFGTGRNFLKKSSQIKKFIFETLLSFSNHDYYSTARLVREAESEIKEKKSELNFKQKMFDEIVKSLNLGLYNIDDVSKNIIELQREKEGILNSPVEGENKKAYVHSLKHQIENIQQLILDYRNKEKELKIELSNANRLYRMERKEIKTLEILATSPSLYENIDDTCPICGKTVIRDESKCICGNEYDLNIFHFTYTNDDYADILKSKVSINTTTLSVINGLKSELEIIKQNIGEKENQLEQLSNEIKQITSQVVSSDVEQIILSINRQIADLSEIQIRLNTFQKENDSIGALKSQIESMQVDLDGMKKRLKELEENKYNTLQEHIDRFQDLLNEYLEKYYTSLNQDFDYKMILNKDYSPIAGKHNPHSQIAEIKVFFYLTFLKYSILNSSISYPKLLIIDTIKDHGLDKERIEKIMESIFEFDKDNCQIVMTCGYEEFQNFEKQYSTMVIDRIGNSKLLSKKVK